MVGNNEFKQYDRHPVITESSIKKQRVIDIGSPECQKTCLMCGKDYLCDSDETRRVFYELSKKPYQDGFIFSSGTQYHETKNEMFMCRKCATSFASCEMCGKKFMYSSIRQAYDDPGLKKMSDVCLVCYEFEACSECGYLGGASPCRWCR